MVGWLVGWLGDGRKKGREMQVETGRRAKVTLASDRLNVREQESVYASKWRVRCGCDGSRMVRVWLFFVERGSGCLVGFSWMAR